MFVAGSGRHDHFFEVEYGLDHRIHTYPKPVVAVMDGIAMGGGMGIAQGAALRIAGPRTKVAMPETRIGFFPDVGGTWFLQKGPGHVPMYLGLTGVAIGGADSLYAGLVDACFSPASIAALDAELPAGRRRPGPPRGARGPGPAPRHRAGARRARGAAARHRPALRPGRAWRRSSRPCRPRTAPGSWPGRPRPPRCSPSARRRSCGSRSSSCAAAADLGLADCFRLELNLIARVLRAARLRRGHPGLDRGQGQRPPLEPTLPHRGDRRVGRGLLRAALVPARTPPSPSLTLPGGTP